MLDRDACGVTFVKEWDLLRCDCDGDDDIPAIVFMERLEGEHGTNICECDVRSTDHDHQDEHRLNCFDESSNIRLSVGTLTSQEMEDEALEKVCETVEERMEDSGLPTETTSAIDREEAHDDHFDDDNVEEFVDRDTLGKMERKCDDHRLVEEEQTMLFRGENSHASNPSNRTNRPMFFEMIRTQFNV